ncbi:MAG TPA: ATP-binding protein [Streptomyces sp.]|nr:ATP-binding protein [Streptomyces sp.]
MKLEIRPDPAEVARARKWARSRLAGSGIQSDEPIAETLILLVSELVTNAVVHTGCPAVLWLSMRGSALGGVTVRLEVADRGAGAPVPRCPDGDATGGRGLALVDGLADRWGWHPEGVGKRVWCELDRRGRGRVPGTTARTGGAVPCGGAPAPAPPPACDGLMYERQTVQSRQMQGFAREAV